MRKFKMILFMSFVCWLIPGLVKAQYTETKEIIKHFKITPTTSIDLTNKYGKIDINNWDKDSVVIEIHIKVEARKLSKLEEIVSGIDFDITDNEHYLIVRTNVDKNKNSLGKEIKKFKESILKADGNIQVDYLVWMPATNELKIENKFGDIYIGDYDGEVEIKLSNGNLKAHNFNNKVELIMNFADATINSIKEGQLDCNFSEIYIKKSGELKVNSKSSDFELNRISMLDAESRRDKFRIKEAELIKAQSSFTIFRIDELSDHLTLSSQYGNIELEKAAPDFSEIHIESKSTDINLYFRESSNFNFEITHTNSELDLCPEMKTEEEETLDEKTQKIKLSGKFGTPVANAANVNITAEEGEINIRTEL